MAFKYYDDTKGTERFKRRYVWALCGFASGLVVGLIAFSLL